MTPAKLLPPCASPRRHLPGAVPVVAPVLSVESVLLSPLRYLLLGFVSRPAPRPWYIALELLGPPAARPNPQALHTRALPSSPLSNYGLAAAPPLQRRVPPKQIGTPDAVSITPIRRGLVVKDQPQAHFTPRLERETHWTRRTPPLPPQNPPPPLPGVPRAQNSHCGNAHRSTQARQHRRYPVRYGLAEDPHPANPHARRMFR
jgi:hypothetical protein